MTVKVLAFAGSARRDSYNKRLVKIAADGARAAGAEVTLLDLAELPLPLFNQDEEAADGLPENARELKRLMNEADALLISSPEYNSSVTALLKNTIDWASRKAEFDDAPLAAFRGKTAVLMSASPGALGGLRGLVHLRAILGNIGVLVLPEQRAVSQAFKAFTDDGKLADEKQQAAIEGLGKRLVEVAGKLAG